MAFQPTLVIGTVFPLGSIRVNVASQFPTLSTGITNSSTPFASVILENVVETASGFVIFILSAMSLTPFPDGSLTVVSICSLGSSDRVIIVRGRLTSAVRLDESKPDIAFQLI